MRLIVWILEPDAAVAADLTAAWRSIAGTDVVIQVFSSLPALPETETKEEKPDLC